MVFDIGIGMHTVSGTHTRMALGSRTEFRMELDIRMHMALDMDMDIGTDIHRHMALDIRIDNNKGHPYISCNLPSFHQHPASMPDSPYKSGKLGQFLPKKIVL